MSKYIYEKGEATIKLPKCTICTKYNKNICKIYNKNIPKKIRYEFGDCSYFLKIK